MKRQLTIKFLGGLLNLITCLIAVTIILCQQDWFGKGDVYALIFWTIPLAAGLSVSGSTIINLLKTGKVILRVLIIFLVSGLIAYGWIYFVFLMLGPWINTFSFPILYLWTIGNFSQLLFNDRFLRKNNKPKWILGLIAFPLTLIGSVILLYSFSSLRSYLTRPDPETYLIHKNFEGKFRVIYGEKCGLEPRTENGRRILEIPDNGILLIKPEFNAGVINNEYYILDDTGTRVKLSEMWTYEQRIKMTPGVLMGGSGGMEGATSDGSSSSDSPLAIQFTDFTVFNRDTIGVGERTRFTSDRRFDSLTFALVANCRKNNGN